MLAGVPPYQAEDTRKLEGLIRSKRPPRALPASCPAGLRAVVMKSLAPDAGKRYRSAVEFQADLQLFLERKPTLAEIERRPTLESHRHTRSGARSAAPRHADGAAQAGAPPAGAGRGGVLRHRHAAVDRGTARLAAVADARERGAARPVAKAPP